jgi:hypothetical protein
MAQPIFSKADIAKNFSQSFKAVNTVLLTLCKSKAAKTKRIY